MLNATVSPFAELYGFFYHFNGLHNFVIASLMNSRAEGSFKKHTTLQN
jgi:hypothetical protein